MEKELAEQEAVHELNLEYAKRAEVICAKWKGKKKPGRDGADTQELKKLNDEFGKRLFELKEKYANKHSE